VPNEAYICALYLAKNKRAIAYQLGESDTRSTEQSVIKIFHAQEEKALHEIQHAGIVKSMRWVKQDLFAVTTEGSSDIVLYNYQQGMLAKTLFIPKPEFPQYAILTLSSSYLVYSTYQVTPRNETSRTIHNRAMTHLHVYDTEKFSYKRIPVQGIISDQTALTISNHLLFCEISADCNLVALSRVHAYNLQTGTLLRQIGEVKINDLPFWFAKPFLRILNNEYLFRARISDSHPISSCSLYPLHSLSQPVTFEIRHEKESFFCALPQGGVAVVPPPNLENNSVSISIYHLLESKTPEIVTFKLPLKLKTPEDVTFLLAQQELPRLKAEIRNIAKALGKLSLFPEPVEKLVTAYTFSSEAQEDRFVDEIVEGSWPKPQ